MSIQFDTATANELIRTLETADDALRDQSLFRNGAAERAMEDFVGAYGTLFRLAVATEKRDRVRLARVLYELAEAVKQTVVKAREERERLKELADWRMREAEREQRRQTDAFGDSFTAGVDSFFDPRPSEIPIQPPTISASFTAQQRTRRATGAGPGKSSADPAKLRTFVSQSGTSNIDLESQLSLVRRAWSAFGASCSWARVESTTFLAGFQQFLNENRRDVDWIDGVAAAFEAAGGGILSNAVIDLSVTAVHPMSDADLLAALSALTAEEIAILFQASPRVDASLGVHGPGGDQFLVAGNEPASWLRGPVLRAAEAAA